MSAEGSPWRRRALLAGGVAALAAWTLGLPRLLVGGDFALVFRDLAGLEPFRMLETSGTVSGAGSVLAGLEASVPAPGQDPRADVGENLCAALFGTEPDPRLPVAFFSDSNCPNCRVLNVVLEDYDAAHPGTIRIQRHELPLLGAASSIASTAVLAADLQGGGGALRGRLMRAQLVTDLGYVIALAQSIGLDGERLAKDMQRPEIAAALERSSALAGLFGFNGAPSAVIGRTAFVGSIPAADVAQIIALELAEPKPVCSAA